MISGQSDPQFPSNTALGMLAGWQPQSLWAGVSNDDRGNGITKTRGKRKWRDSAKGNKFVIKGHLFLTFLSFLSSNSITPIPPTIYTQQGSCVCAHSFSRVRLSATLWTAAPQAPLSMGFSRQDFWSGSPCPPPGELLGPRRLHRRQTLYCLTQQGRARTVG